VLRFLDVDTIAFTVIGYPLSYIEAIGTVLYLASVWLVARRNVLTWPVGIVSVLLYMALFYQVALYADALEQGYYLVASVYGWIYWSRSAAETVTTTGARYGTRRSMAAWAGATFMASILLASFVGRLHLLAPSFFPEPASYPFLDSLTTAMSLTAMWLLARKRIESWIYWIVVDVIAVGLYYVKNVRFIALLYVALLMLAIRGLVAWHRASRATVEVIEPVTVSPGA
jgi:nicotinamide mononucleotide transporter